MQSKNAQSFESYPDKHVWHLFIGRMSVRLSVLASSHFTGTYKDCPRSIEWQLRRLSVPLCHDLVFTSSIAKNGPQNPSCVCVCCVCVGVCTCVCVCVCVNVCVCVCIRVHVKIGYQFTMKRHSWVHTHTLTLVLFTSTHSSKCAVTLCSLLLT